MAISSVDMRRALIFSAVLSLTAPGAAVAQDAATPGGESADSGTRQLEAITVTARRQEERLQDTPVSVSALSAQALERLNVQEIEKVAQFTPNVGLTPASNNPFGVVAFIRGIGSQENLLTVDAPVGLYLDGVYLGRQNNASFDLIDLERIEVLRGPQGTLFGRNTTGGAINMVARLPSKEFKVDEKVGFGSFDEWYSRTRVNTGELGNTGLRATVAYLHRERNGYVDNPITDASNDPGAYESDAVWLSLHGEWDKFSATFSGNYHKAEASPPPFKIVAVAPQIAAYFNNSVNYGGLPLIVSPTRFEDTQLVRFDPEKKDFVPGETYSNGGVQETEIKGSSLTMQYDLNPAASVKSISAYREWEGVLPNNYSNGGILGPASFLDGSNAGVQEVSPFISAQIYDQHQFSQELQLLGHTERWKYVLGAYYFKEYVHEVNPTYFSFVLSPDFALNFRSLLDYEGNSKSLAGFGQASYRPAVLGDRLELTAGARYTKDDKDITVDNPALTGNPTNLLFAQGAKDFSNFSYNLSAGFDWTDDLMSYARVSTAYRSGGFSPRNAGLPSFAFRPEEATTFEIGAKSEWLDHRLRLNAAAFYTKYEDLQVAQYTGGNGFTENANAHYTGFELEMQALPTDHIAIDASIGYVDPVYDDFPVGNPNGPGSIDVSDSAHIPYNAKLTTHIGAQYTLPSFPIGELSVRADWSHQSERWFHAENISNPFNDVIRDPGQDRVSARVLLADIPLGGTTLDVSVFGENLLDDDLTTAGVDFGAALGFAGLTYDLPRHYGIDFRLQF